MILLATSVFHNILKYLKGIQLSVIEFWTYSMWWKLQNLQTKIAHLIMQ